MLISEVWLCRDVVSLCHNLFPKESAFITISPSSFTRPVINIFMAPWVFRHHIVPHHILLTVWGFKDCAFIREDLQMYKKWKQCTTSQDSAGHCNKDKNQIKKQKTLSLCIMIRKMLLMPATLFFVFKTVRHIYFQNVYVWNRFIAASLRPLGKNGSLHLRFSPPVQKSWLFSALQLPWCIMSSLQRSITHLHPPIMGLSMPTFASQHKALSAVKLLEKGVLICWS